MEVLLKSKHADYLSRTYPNMSLDQAVNAFLNDSLNDQTLLHRAAERKQNREDYLGACVILFVVIVFAWFSFR